MRIQLLPLLLNLLRRAPTQSGVTYPKYYAWVKVKDSAGITVAAGAVRLAAIAQERFEITDFIDAAEIWRDPAAPRRVFPAALCDAIVARAAPARSSSP